MAIKFTEKQQEVIDLHGENILVSAAAGSGKTAVLVQRIIEMISNPDKPVDIDRLLVVTFTNAAAAQMRERISNAIADRLEEEPENEHLQKQSALIHNALITTIDSFCLFVLKNHFQEIGLDPGFRVADEGEVSLLGQEALEELLEEEYGLAEPEFLKCVECYCTGKKETVLEENILELHRFAMSNPWPREWLREHAKDYDYEDEADMEASEPVQYLLRYLKRLLPEYEEALSECISICEEPDGPYMYADSLEKTMQSLGRCRKAGSFDEMRHCLSEVVFDSFSNKRDASVNTDKKERIKEQRNQIKKKLESLKEKLFCADSGEFLRRSREMSPVVKELMYLAEAYGERFSKKKREKNIIDFSDMEHLALDILCKREGDMVKATPAALELRKYFHEIMIDEYQDSNLVQECILTCISREEEGEFNRFMVGDVKQSIYKFRLARPELFMEKYRTYEKEKGPRRRIDLHQNFRSREEVVDSVNAVFYQLLGEDMGGITYDTDSALHLGASYPEDEGNDNRTEVLIVSEDEESDKSRMEQEAEAVALKMLSLKKTFKVTDRKTGGFRPVRFSDMVILLRSGADTDETFQRVLESYGIPAFITTGTGYFAAPEINIVMQLLRCLDNPLQDPAFYALLTSYFGGFSEEEIATVKCKEDMRYLYRKCRKYAESEEDGNSFRLRRFFAWFDGLRKKVSYLSITELLEEILEMGGYLNYVTALPGGEKRRANTLMLMEKAGSFQQTSFRGLYHFIRYVDRLKKYDIDYGEASVVDENADVVRIMTIHKSKGLEFPVCFLAGTGRKLNRRDASKPVLTHVESGVGVDCVNPEKRTKSSTLRKAVLSIKTLLEGQAEELRILYTAMTRAEEKLIITGVMKAPEGKIAAYEMLKNHKNTLLPYYIRSSAGSYMELILPAICRMEEEKSITWEIYEKEKLEKEELHHKKTIVSDGILFKNTLNEYDLNEKMKEIFQNIFEFRYPHENLKNLFTKTTVTELKRISSETDTDAKSLFKEEQITPYVPVFLRKDEKIRGAIRGNAYHHFMQLYDFKCGGSLSEIDRQITLFLEQERMEKEEVRLINKDKIKQFMDSSIGRRMITADCNGRLYREKPFVLGITADRLNPEFPKEEQVLIQGIIDVFWEEEEELILADYKTDSVSSKEELTERYRVQLQYYTEALERICGKKVKEKFIYSFGLGAEIRLN